MALFDGLRDRLFAPFMTAVFPRQANEMRRIMETAAKAYHEGPYVLTPDKLIEQLQENGLLSDLFTRLELDEFDLLYGTGPFDLTAYDRARAVQYAKHMARANVAIERAVEIWTDFTLGQQVQVTSDNPQATVVIEEAMKADRNNAVLSDESIEQFSYIALNEGEVAIAHWFGLDGRVTIRPVPSEQLEIKWLDPNDKRVPLWYVRKTENGEYWFPDWRATPDKLERVQPPRHAINLANPEGDVQTVSINGRDEPITRAVMQWHVRKRQDNGRGLPQFLGVMSWANQLTEFTSNRAAVARKAAMYTDNVKVRGGSRAVAAAQQRLQSSLANTTSGAGSWFDRNPPSTAGSDWIENEFVERTWQTRDTAAGSARYDGRMIAGVVSLGVGVPLHWLGFPDAIPGGLATARELLRPWLEQLQRYRVWITAVYRTMGQVIAKVGGIDITAEEVVVNLDIDKQLDIGVLITLTEKVGVMIEKGTFDPIAGDLILRALLSIILKNVGVPNAEELVAVTPETEEQAIGILEVVKTAVSRYREGETDPDQLIDFLVGSLVVERIVK